LVWPENKPKTKPKKKWTKFANSTKKTQTTWTKRIKHTKNKEKRRTPNQETEQTQQHILEFRPDFVK
jgi:hypothetical protein